MTEGTVGSAMFTAIFNLVMCQTTVIFEIMKDVSLLIHSLAPEFSIIQLFHVQKPLNDMSKMVNMVNDIL